MKQSQAIAVVKASICMSSINLCTVFSQILHLWKTVSNLISQENIMQYDHFDILCSKNEVSCIYTKNVYRCLEWAMLTYSENSKLYRKVFF